MDRRREKGIIHSDLRKEIHSFLNIEIYLCDKNIDLSCKSQEEIDFYDYMGNKQHSKQSHGVVLQPTTYVLGLTDYYEILINDYNRRDVLI